MNIQSVYPFPRTPDTRRRTLVLRIWAAIGLCMVVFLALIFPLGTQAATIVVDTTDDDPTKTACTVAPSDCSLRGAIITANNAATHPGSDTITLPAGTYTLDEFGTDEYAALNGDLDIKGDLVINGAGQLTTIIDGNSAVTGERVFWLDGSFSAEFNDLTITGGSDSSGGGILAFGSLTLNDVVVDNNQAVNGGGGIYAQSALTLSDTIVSNNSADSGAGMYVNNGPLDISSSSIFSNSAVSSGGGFEMVSGTATIDGNTQIYENQVSGGSGGGIFFSSSTLTMDDSQVYMNDASNGGGGMFIASGASVTLNNTVVSRNDATGTGSEGGGIAIYGSLEMHGGQVALNTADYSGGGISLGSYGTADIYDAFINDNYTTANPSYGGGGIYNSGGQVTLEGSTVTGNYLSGSVSSSTYGGGIFSWGGDLTITDSKITSNDAIAAGGGVFFTYGNLTITNSIFQGNEVNGTPSSGGGLFNGFSSTTTIKQTEFSANVAADNGGGIHNQGSLTLENVTLSGNSAPSGGGMDSTGSDTTSILNTTITGNLVPPGGFVGGLVAYNSVTIKNSIISGNESDQCYNDSGSKITSNGYNISGDATCGFGAPGDQPYTVPLLGPLADNGGFSKTHALLPDSPGIDEGNPAVPGSGGSACAAEDQRGWIRPIDGDLNGTARCDIGAYEATIDLFLPLIMR